MTRAKRRRRGGGLKLVLIFISIRFNFVTNRPSFEWMEKNEQKTEQEKIGFIEMLEGIKAFYKWFFVVESDFE